MPPAFSNALYYPTIDINDLSWLKTALLFWDSISTIVPEHLQDPYQHHDTRYLADIGFLRPLRVNPHDVSVVGIEEDIINLLYSPEFIHSLHSMPRDNSYSGIWTSKMSYRIREEIDDLFRRNRGTLLYRDKMSYLLQMKVRDCIEEWSQNDEIFYLNEDFAYIYMMALAERISENRSLAMVTDSLFSFNTENNMRLCNQATILPSYDRSSRYRVPQIEQGLLLNFIVQGLSISPDNDLKDILSFKNRHRDELGRFKTELANLTQGLETGQSVDALREDISNLYVNRFTPAFNDFKAALKDSRIKWFSETFLKVSAVTASATGIPMALLGMPVDQAIYAGVGLSVIASTVSYNIQKREVIRNNPYSYLLSIQKEWG